MEALFLREWQRNSPWQILLRPLSWLFGLFAAGRRAMFRAGLLSVHHAGVPVVVVGNITVGGTGKTPLVLAITGMLSKAGYRCGIVTRGYSRDRTVATRVRAVHVLPGDTDVAIVGDEAVLLASRTTAPVFAAARRIEAVRALLKSFAETDVIICDDGLQHYALHRDIEICVIDGMRGIGNRHLLPAGPLREAAVRLTSVDAIVVNGTGAAGTVLARNIAIPPGSLHTMLLGNEAFIALKDGEALSTDQARRRFAGKRVHVLAGIGNPQRFFDHVAQMGVIATATRAFPDHHDFTASDLDAVDADIVLMTEKDAVKCRSFADDRMWFMRVDAVLPAAFGEFLVNRLSEVNPRHVARSQTA